MLFRCVAAIPNGGGNCHEHFYPDTPDGHASAQAWTQQYADGWGVYDCVSPLRDRKRTKDNVAQIIGLHADLDVYKSGTPKAEVIEKLRDTLTPFGILSLINSSGRGLQVYFLFREPIEAGTPEAERAQLTLKRLVAHLGADPQPAHFAALMRRVGTMNSKDGGGPCETLLDTGTRCELSDVEAYLDLVESKGELFPTDEPGEARDAGPVNVEESLAAMVPSGTSVNATQKRVIPSLIWQAWHPDDIVSFIVERTMQMAANNNLGWNAEIERECVRKRVQSAYQNLFMPEYDHTTGEVPTWLNMDFHEAWMSALAAGRRPVMSRNHKGWHVRSFVVGASPAAEGSVIEGNVVRLVQPEPQPPQPERKVRFKLVAFKDMRPGLEQLYLVDELIPIAGLVDIWGKPKCYKSFWTLDLMFHVAMGWEYRDRGVKQGTVVYCAFEGGHGYRKRIEAIRRLHELRDNEEVPLYVISGQANLIADHKQLVGDIVFQLGDIKPICVVLDTLNKSLMGSESKDTDMSAYVRAAEAIRDAFSCVVVIVHHCGLDDSRPRGHTSLPGAVDAQLAVARQGNAVTVTVEMMRDGPEETIVTGILKPQEVGQDHAGKMKTSLVVTPGEARTEGAIGRRWNGHNLGLLKRSLAEAMLNNPITHHIPNGPTVRTANKEDVRDEFYKIFLGDDDEKGGDKKPSTETKRKAFSRAIKTAQERNLISGYVTTRATLIWFAAAAQEPTQ